MTDDQPSAFQFAQQRGQIRRAHPLGGGQLGRCDVAAKAVDRAKHDQLRELHRIGLRLATQAAGQGGDLAAQMRCQLEILVGGHIYLHNHSYIFIAK